MIWFGLVVLFIPIWWMASCMFHIRRRRQWWIDRPEERPKRRTRTGL